MNQDKAFRRYQTSVFSLTRDWILVILFLGGRFQHKREINMYLCTEVFKRKKNHQNNEATQPFGVFAMANSNEVAAE